MYPNNSHNKPESQTSKNTGQPSLNPRASAFIPSAQPHITNFEQLQTPPVAPYSLQPNNDQQAHFTVTANSGSQQNQQDTDTHFYSAPDATTITTTADNGNTPIETASLASSAQHQASSRFNTGEFVSLINQMLQTELNQAQIITIQNELEPFLNQLKNQNVINELGFQDKVYIFTLIGKLSATKTFAANDCWKHIIPSLINSIVDWLHVKQVSTETLADIFYHLEQLSQKGMVFPERHYEVVLSELIKSIQYIAIPQRRLLNEQYITNVLDSLKRLMQKSIKINIDWSLLVNFYIEQPKYNPSSSQIANIMEIIYLTSHRGTILNTNYQQLFVYLLKNIPSAPKPMWAITNFLGGFANLALRGFFVNIDYSTLLTYALDNLDNSKKPLLYTTFVMGYIAVLCKMSIKHKWDLQLSVDLAKVITKFESYYSMTPDPLKLECLYQSINLLYKAGIIDKDPYEAAYKSKMAQDLPASIKLLTDLAPNRKSQPQNSLAPLLASFSSLMSTPQQDSSSKTDDNTHQAQDNSELNIDELLSEFKVN